MVWLSAMDGGSLMCIHSTLSGAWRQALGKERKTDKIMQNRFGSFRDRGMKWRTEFVGFGSQDMGVKERRRDENVRRIRKKKGRKEKEASCTEPRC
jgi:hypothetical protein